MGGLRLVGHGRVQLNDDVLAMIFEKLATIERDEETKSYTLGCIRGHRGGRLALANVCLVNRRFKMLAEPYLYRVFIKPSTALPELVRNYGRSYINCRRLRTFLRTTLARPVLASYIKTLIIDEWDPCTAQISDRNSFFQLPKVDDVSEDVMIANSIPAFLREPLSAMLTGCDEDAEVATLLCLARNVERLDLILPPTRFMNDSTGLLLDRKRLMSEFLLAKILGAPEDTEDRFQRLRSLGVRRREPPPSSCPRRSARSPNGFWACQLINIIAAPRLEELYTSGFAANTECYRPYKPSSEDQSLVRALTWNPLSLSMTTMTLDNCNLMLESLENLMQGCRSLKKLSLTYRNIYSASRASRVSAFTWRQLLEALGSQSESLEELFLDAEPHSLLACQPSTTSYEPIGPMTHFARLRHLVIPQGAILAQGDNPQDDCAPNLVVNYSLKSRLPASLERLAIRDCGIACVFLLESLLLDITGSYEHGRVPVALPGLKSLGVEPFWMDPMLYTGMPQWKRRAGVIREAFEQVGVNWILRTNKELPYDYSDCPCLLQFVDQRPDGLLPVWIEDTL